MPRTGRPLRALLLLILLTVLPGLLAGPLGVLPVEFLRQDYALALPQGSPLRAPMNVAILEVLESDEWQRVLRRYLGN